MRHHVCKRVVVKVGTSTLTYENSKPNFRRMERIARVLSDFKNAGNEVILVSSGAVAVGVNRMGLAERPRDTKGRQAASAVGQCSMMSLYDRFFSEYGQVVGQILLTRDVIEDDARKRNVVNTFHALLENGTIPIVNENDSVSTEELEGTAFGDNDKLSAIVAAIVNADTLIILTDTDGLYDADPRENPAARLIETVEVITPEMLRNAGGNGTARGTGGMKTKLEAAAFATGRGIDVFVVNGQKWALLYDILNGGFAGTYFKGQSEAK